METTIMNNLKELLIKLLYISVYHLNETNNDKSNNFIVFILKNE